MNKVLTIAVPAYNAGWCIENCLSSLIDERVMDYMEVIVIDDGSTDDTFEVASAYVYRYPNTFRIIKKENGGHGTAINTAIKEAAGKYFKVVDADDRVITENLAPYIDYLRVNDADVVLTHFYTVDISTGRRQKFLTRGLRLDEVYAIDAFAAFSPAAFKCATFHGITYLTEFYRSTGLSLPGKVFYEDQEYATSPFAYARTVLPLDIFLYEYMLGSDSQSVSDTMQVKKIADIEKIALDVVDCFNKNSGMSEGRKRIFIYKICAIIKSYYVVALIKKRDRKAGRRDAVRFRRKLAALNAMLASRTNRDYNIILLLHYLHINSDMFQRMKRSSILRFLYGSRKRGA